MRADVASARDRDLIWVETPFEEPTARIVVAAARAGAFGVLDLGADAERARSALDLVTRRTDAPFGVRVSADCPLGLADLPEAVTTIVVAEPGLVAQWRDPSHSCRMVTEVRSTDEARTVLAEPGTVDGLVARGAESGGRVGTTGAYVLCQQVRALTDLPVWVQGGIGRHTAAAAVIGGAAGVVVDAQVALLREATLPPPVRKALRAMDGSETRVVDGRRIYDRPLEATLRRGPADQAANSADRTSTNRGDRTAGQALPTGQDAAFASRFADRYSTVGRMVTALRREIAEHVELARQHEPLAPGHGVSTVLGTRYPVVQGPMTRVSDRPEFAAAVAEAGGLPFLALALLRADEVRPLLEETAALVADKPWGVGVLGFVPKDLREEQLEVIRDVRPPLALIAGGRPSQAAALEDADIRTFLHVPAPGLLERFLKDGARRFVFEGFECGGHVGPRSSFALWETQLEILLDWGEESGALGELDVLFAGGIHDERSAAMVSALSAPLAAAGARVGLLMGTAYLFTEEAVAAGAIGEEFQAQALACERTALLESGPGHATRCAETPFVELFEQTRRELAARGADAQLQWAELESLNLGRLRVASKGLKRDGDELALVDRDEQRHDGMFMIGDVATLHRELTTIAQLHETVSAGASAYLAAEAEALAAQEVARRDAVRPSPAPVDIAIVGMACVMPGAPDLDTYWKNILEGVNSITEVPAERWDTDKYFDPDWNHATAQKAKDIRSASKWGGFVPDIPFDALAYGIPPASLAAIEPTQLLALKVAADALADAGYSRLDTFDRARTSVIFGAEAGSDQLAAHCFRALFPAYAGELPPELDQWLPEMTEDTFPGLLTNVISGRIANRLDLGGKNLTVDAACASSLAALDAGCIELASGGSDLVLCGGADVHNGVHDYLLFTSVHALSTIGQCRTFDAEADGIALGEGVACVVLKRLADAERDGDRVYAVIKSVAGSSDGRSLGLTAPRREGQVLSLQRAYAQAGIDADEVGLIEAHGTGTVVGDRTELSTLTEVFAEAGVERGSCVVGSVKSNIGHTKCAAGLAGLIKAAKAVHHGVLPRTLHIDQPNPAWDPDTSPFVFLDDTRPWLDRRRVAGVSAFGFGGTNFHAVLESHDEEMSDAVASSAWPAELFLFRGELPAVDQALAELAERLEDLPTVERTQRLRDAAASCALAGRGPVRVAIVAEDFADLRAKVEHARQGRPAPGVHLADPEQDIAGPSGDPPPVAFLFPGQGSQRPGMASDLFVTFAETRSLLDLGAHWVPTMLPPQPFGDEQREAQRRALTDTRVAQPALGLADLAAARVLARFGVRPDMVAGHSYGELVALCVAGALDEQSLLQLSEARAQAIVAAVRDDPGGMVAVSSPYERLEPVLDGIDVVVANDNHPEQLVLAGPTPAIEEAQGRLKDAGLTARRLPVACAFHSPLVASASSTLEDHLADVEIAAPRIPVFSNRTSSAYPGDPGEVRELIAAQVAHPVRFTEEIEAMYAAGARVFLEVGPGRVLTGCVERILADRPHLAVATDRPGDHGVRSMLQALAQIAVAGVAVDVPQLFEGRAVEATRWSRPAASPRWMVNGHLVRTADGEVVPGGLRPATSVPQVAPLVAANGDRNGIGVPSTNGAGTRANGSSNGNGNGDGTSNGGGSRPADEVLVEYFRAANQIIGAGHQLVMNYLGIEPGSAPQVTAPVPQLQPQSGAAATQPVLPAPAGPATTASPSGSPAEPVSEIETRTLPTPEELLAKLVAIVSVRTGYPEDMLDPDLDVEADLSIDSIKRLEILAALADEVELSDDGSLVDMEDLVEELAARKTLRGIVDFLFEHAPGLGNDDQLGPGDDGEPGDHELSSGADQPFRSPIPPLANCFTVNLADAPLAPPANTGARRVEVTGTSPLAPALVEELGARGIPASTASTATLAGTARTEELVVLTDLLDACLGDGEAVDAPELYRRLRPLLLDTTCDVVVVTPLGGGVGIDPPPPRHPDPTSGTGGPDAEAVPLGAGARGLVKTAALEFPDRQVRLVDVDPAAPVDQLARTLADEALQAGAPVEVGWHDGRRRTPVLSLRPDRGRDGRGELPLDRDSVVLFTGGARGITARAAVALARCCACRVELVGRSALPEGDEDPTFSGCEDRVGLRSALAAAGWREPKAIEKEVERILSEREIRRTLADLAAAGSSVDYHQVDVRDEEALASLVEGIYGRHGRLDGIVHGAGVVDDHLIADKSPAEFQRVFSTKVDAARTLLAAVRRATADGTRARPSFVAFFGSIAGVWGNRGQADYAAANDALDAIAAANRDLAVRMVSIDWGPWSAETGMVSDSLVRLFEDSGMGLIQVDDGTSVLLDEIAPGADGSAPQVVVARCAPEVVP